jgi:hypothetical protein
MAWEVPPMMVNIKSYSTEKPSGSMVPWAQNQLAQATQQALAAVARDVVSGLQETVGLPSQWGEEFAEHAKCSVILDLPSEANPEFIARAIDLENVEAWCDENRRVHVAIGPWYSTKDVDQVVLSVTKVIHVLLGMHA